MLLVSPWAECLSVPSIFIITVMKYNMDVSVEEARTPLCDKDEANIDLKPAWL